MVGFETALLAATRLRNGEMVRLLLAYGAAVNNQDIDGLTPLIYAAANGDYVLAEMLMEAGADPFLTAIDGHCAYSYAVRYKHARIVELLDKAFKHIC